MQKKVEAILTIVKTVYQQTSDMFHDYFINEFKSNIISEHYHNNKLLKFDEKPFNTFVDYCILYRMGIYTKEPKISDIIYDLTSENGPEVYVVSLDDVLEKMIYSALPKDLVNQLKSRIEGYNLNESIVDLIISKLE